jgi:hypothetical protein
MKAKVRFEVEIDLPNNLMNFSDSEIVNIIDQEIRDQLYVGAEYSSTPEDFIKFDSLKVKEYYNLSQRFDQVYTRNQLI